MGVPERYFYVHPKEIPFCQYEYSDEYDNKEYSISIQKQKEFAKKILNSKNMSGVVAIGSNPTCDLALALLFYYAKKFYKKGKKILIHNMSSGINFLEIEEDIEAIFLYNINADDDLRRLQQVRDIIFQTDNRLRFVAFAGDNPLKFFCEKIRYYPTSYFYLMGKYRKIIISD